MDQQRRVKEILELGRDPIKFISNYCKVQHPTKGLLTLKLFPFQEELVRTFQQNKDVIILKGRQLGVTTVTAAYAVWLALFRKDQNIMVIATKSKTAKTFIRKVKTILAYAPQWLFLTEKTVDNAQSVEFSNGSRIEAISTSEDAGRSEGISLLIVDEAAFISGMEDLWAGLQPTLSTGGKCIMMSTPKGVGNQFHSIWVEAESNLNGFYAVKLPWYVHPERDESWFAEMRKKLPPKNLAQEHLCEYLTSGDTFIAPEDISWVNECSKPPVDRLGPDKNVWVWERAKAGHNYVIGADVSSGTSRDYSAFHVIDTSVGEQVAEYKGKLKPDELGDLLNAIGRMYNTALLAVESNTGWAAMTLSRLKELEYSKIFYEDAARAAFAGAVMTDGHRPGFSTQGNSRQQILSKLEELLRNKQLAIRSSRTYHEFLTFVWNGVKPSAAKNQSDDLVMSLAIASWLYDAAGASGRYSKSVADAMLAGMSVVTSDVASERLPSSADVLPGSGVFAAYGPDGVSVPGRARLAMDAQADPYAQYRWVIGR